MTVTPRAFSAANALKELVRAGWREHRGRFVEDQHARLGHQRARDLDALLRFDRQIANAPAHIRGDVERGRDGSAIVGEFDGA